MPGLPLGRVQCFRIYALSQIEDVVSSLAAPRWGPSRTNSLSKRIPYSTGDTAGRNSIHMRSKSEPSTLKITQKYCAPGSPLTSMPLSRVWVQAPSSFNSKRYWGEDSPHKDPGELARETEARSGEPCRHRESWHERCKGSSLGMRREGGASILLRVILKINLK